MELDRSPPDAAEGPSNEVGYAVGHSLAARQDSTWRAFFATGLYLGAAVVGWLLLRSLLEMAGLGWYTRLAGWAVLALFLIFAIHWKDALPRAVDGASIRVMGWTDDSRRVWCVWSKWRLQRLAALGPIADEAFEPELFAAPFAIPRSTRSDVVLIAAAILSYGVLYLVLDLFGHSTTTKFNFTMFCSSLAMGWFLLAAAMPTTIRIVPGRIDVMRGWFFSTDRVVVRSISMRGRRVVVDLKSGIVFVLGPARDEQQELAALYGPAKLRARIAHAILRAAVSTAEPAPLPANEVVG
jgi:hypothetical protein